MQRPMYSRIELDIHTWGTQYHAQANGWLDLPDSRSYSRQLVGRGTYPQFQTENYSHQIGREGKITWRIWFSKDFTIGADKEKLSDTGRAIGTARLSKTAYLDIGLPDEHLDWVCRTFNMLDRGFGQGLIALQAIEMDGESRNKSGVEYLIEGISITSGTELHFRDDLFQWRPE